MNESFNFLKSLSENLFDFNKKKDNNFLHINILFSSDIHKYNIHFAKPCNQIEKLVYNIIKKNSDFRDLIIDFSDNNDDLYQTLKYDTFFYDSDIMNFISAIAIFNVLKKGNMDPEIISKIVVATLIEIDDETIEDDEMVDQLIVIIKVGIKYLKNMDSDFLEQVKTFLKEK